MSNDTEEVVAQLVAEKLPRHAAPPALVERIAAQVRVAENPSPARRRPWRGSALGMTASALLSAAAVLALVWATQPNFLRRPSRRELAAEAVDDHLRVVTSAHPYDIESGGMHQVKPWFTGRLDFAPRLSFAGDDHFELVGGSLGYFRARKAAVFVFKVRLHTITLLVFPAEGLPAGPNITAFVERGFNVLVWRHDELGYALVSDVNRGELDTLAQRLQ